MRLDNVTTQQLAEVLLHQLTSLQCMTIGAKVSTAGNWFLLLPAMLETASMDTQLATGSYCCLKC